MVCLRVTESYSITNRLSEVDLCYPKDYPCRSQNTKFGLQDKLFLGNLDAKRDWGHAKDFVKMMWMILQAPKADDWVIATGTTTSVREFLTLCFKHLGVDLRFSERVLKRKDM